VDSTLQALARHRGALIAIGLLLALWRRRQERRAARALARRIEDAGVTLPLWGLVALALMLHALGIAR